MYHFLVERKLRGVFHRINQGDFWPMIDSLSARFRYRFEGDSAIGGVRSSRDSMQLWWERMYRLFPGFRLEVRDVVVSGWPWRTRIFTQLAFVKPMPGGETYVNVAMQRMTMRWGRIDEVHTLEDTQRCARMLQWQAQLGKAEALAAPITDSEWPERGPFSGASPVPA